MGSLLCSRWLFLIINWSPLLPSSDSSLHLWPVSPPLLLTLFTPPAASHFAPMQQRIGGLPTGNSRGAMRENLQRESRTMTRGGFSSWLQRNFGGEAWGLADEIRVGQHDRLRQRWKLSVGLVWEMCECVCPQSTNMLRVLSFNTCVGGFQGSLFVSEGERFPSSIASQNPKFGKNTDSLENNQKPLGPFTW